jgi:hypothetical protein
MPKFPAKKKKTVNGASMLKMESATKCPILFDILEKSSDINGRTLPPPNPRSGNILLLLEV